jgi:hypothetical protein
MKGRSLYVEKYPEKLFPETIHKTKDGVWISDSSCMEWTNQSVLLKRSLFIDVLMPYAEAHPKGKVNGFPEPEHALNCHWWRKQRFKIGQGAGLFTHRRLDGSFRPNHPAYETPQNQTTQKHFKTK